jgi:hypothetical protein
VAGLSSCSLQAPPAGQCSTSAEDAASASHVSCYCLLTYWSRGSSVSVVARNKRFVFSAQLLAQPLIQWVQGISWPGREANNLPQSSVKVKDGYSYIFTLSYVCMKCSLNVCPV